MREIDGILSIQSEDPEVVAAGVEVLAGVAEEWQAVGLPARAASVLRTTASVALCHLGRYGEAIEAGIAARRLTWNRLYDRALTTVLLARLASLAGRMDLLDRELDAARRLGDAARLPWLDYFVALASMHRAALLQDRDSTAAYAEVAEEALGGLLAHSTAVTFYAEAAMCLAMTGSDAAARRYLARAAARRPENPVEVALAEVVVAARCEHAELAQRALMELLAMPGIPESRIWRAQLEVAIATGDARATATARASASVLGLESLAETIRAAPAMKETVEIFVLGPLRATRGGRAVQVPAGRATELLKLLACHGRLPVEVVLEELWPGDPTPQALRRLKNPLNRLRQALGTGAVVRTATGVGLADDVVVDVSQLEATAQRMVSVGESERAIMAVDALKTYRPLLEDDVSADYIVRRRESVALAAGRMLDLLLDLDDRERPPAAWLTGAAERLGELDDRRFVRIGEFAVREQDLATARFALEQAQSIARDLEVPLDPAADGLARALVGAGSRTDKGRDISR